MAPNPARGLPFKMIGGKPHYRVKCIRCKGQVWTAAGGTMDPKKYVCLTCEPRPRQNEGKPRQQ